MDEDSPLYAKPEAEQAVPGMHGVRVPMCPLGAHLLTHPVGTWPESPFSPSKFSHLAASLLVRLQNHSYGT